MRAFLLLFTSTTEVRLEESVWSAVVDDLPTDPASLFVLFVLVGVTGAILWYGRR